jgi:hypothetical protein
LRAKPASAVRVFVVWEPVLVTDWRAPDPSLTGYVPDTRAVHFWDHDRRLSALLGGADRITALADTTEVGFRMKDVVWDAALIYPPGARWGARATWLAAPVVKYESLLANRL